MLYNIRHLKIYKIRHLRRHKWGHDLKLMRQVSRQVGNNEYAKWMIIIPPANVEKLGWKEGQELESQVKGRILAIKPQAKRKEKSKKMAYEEFRDKIKELLQTRPQGLTWTDIRNTLKLPQKVPNNMWVRMMESDIGLIRELDNKTAKKTWRLRPSSAHRDPLKL